MLRDEMSMVRPPLLLTALASAASLAAATPADKGGEAALAQALAHRVAGTPAACLPERELGSSRIITGTAILYELGDTVYVNRPEGASDLRSDDVLVSRTFGTELCRSDSVTLRDRSGQFDRSFVILGDFVPYARTKSHR